MSKIIQGTCSGGSVYFNGVKVDAKILSEGNGESSGYILIDKEMLFYLTSNATDLKQSLEKVNTVLNKIADTLQDIGAGMNGPGTAPPPTLAVSVADIKQVAVELNELSKALK